MQVLAVQLFLSLNVMGGQILKINKLDISHGLSIRNFSELVRITHHSEDENGNCSMFLDATMQAADALIIQSPQRKSFLPNSTWLLGNILFSL